MTWLMRPPGRGTRRTPESGPRRRFHRAFDGPQPRWSAPWKSSREVRAMSDQPIRHGPTPEESVWSYPRPPRVVPDTRRVTVVHRGVTLADSRNCRRVLETTHPPVFYVPRDDVSTDVLSRSSLTTRCEWKGIATYWTLDLQGDTIPDVAWSYEVPGPGYEDIAFHLAFYAGKVGLCTVDGERVRAQPGDFYGGWITHEIVGPFKGDSGTSRW
ncbi:DUF427 domain-containing protein [Streptomyces gardneri]|uniref:DUF427 domain-containing protein n=1 Tax=Streptomyces gardneri TaxID=66892 RepID=UPI0036930F58